MSFLLGLLGGVNLAAVAVRIGRVRLFGASLLSIQSCLVGIGISLTRTVLLAIDSFLIKVSLNTVGVVLFFFLLGLFVFISLLHLVRVLRVDGIGFVAGLDTFVLISLLGLLCFL